MTSPDSASTRPVRRWWITVSAITLVLLLGAELTIRLGSSKLGEPLVWYSWTAENKAEALEAGVPADADVVFTGSSVVAASLDPSIFMDGDSCGRTAYNASTAGAVPVITDDWLERVVIPALSPKVVVLGIAPCDLAKQSATDIDAYFRAIAIRDDVGARIDRWMSEWSYVVRYRTTLRSPRILKAQVDELRGQGDESKDYDANGFRAIDNAGQEDTTEQTNGPGMVLDDEQVRALDRLVGKLADAGITPVIAAMGSSSRWNSTPRAAQLTKDTDAALERIAAEREVPFVDLRSVSDPKQFVDLVHTNSVGSELESTMITEELQDGPAGCGP